VTRVKIEHYVPQFYLRRWATGRDAIFVFDKPTGRIFQSAVDKAAAEGNFYDLPSQHGEDAQAIEKWLGTFETNLANVLKSAVADLDAGLI